MGVVTSQNQHKISRIPLQKVKTQLNSITCSAVLICAFLLQVQTKNNCNNICRSHCNNVFSYGFYFSFRYASLFNESVFYGHCARHFYTINKLSLRFTVDVEPAGECRYGLETGCVADVWKKTTPP